MTEMKKHETEEFKTLVSERKRAFLSRPPVKECYFVQSTDVDRGILGFGLAKKGVWIEVPFRIYCDIKNSIAGAAGRDCGWKVKTEIKKLEAFK